MRRAIAPGARVRAAHAVCMALRERPEILAAIRSHSPIAVYLASADELRLDEFIAWALSEGAVIVAPRWNGSAYELAEVTSLVGLVRGPHRIREPAKVSSAPVPAVWLVPGLAFTADGGRLGYGGGWYDRLLATSPHAIKLGVGYRFQLLDSLPVEPHDQPMDGFVGV